MTRETHTRIERIAIHVAVISAVLILSSLIILAAEAR